MSEKGFIKHAFLGGNTTTGFFSYYHYILGQDEAKRIICIKGGPGVGKSTFMKRIGDEMVERGYNVEYMHCSSDSNSLDGVVIPKVGIALLDGTSPHIIDPKTPGAVDEILYLGDYWNEDGLRDNKKEIMESTAAISKLFARAYKYLMAAKCIFDDITEIYRGATNAAGVYIETEKIINKEFELYSTAGRLGKVRKLFASAITPNGLCHYLDSIIAMNPHIYIVKGEPGTGTEKFLACVIGSAVARGLCVESYYCSIDPENRIEHVVIPKLNLAFMTANQYHNTAVQTDGIIDLNRYVNRKVINQYKSTLDYDKLVFEQLLEKTIETIGQAKQKHNYLESIYIPNMNFDELQNCWDKTFKRILQYAQET